MHTRGSPYTGPKSPIWPTLSAFGACFWGDSIIIPSKNFGCGNMQRWLSDDGFNVFALQIDRRTDRQTWLHSSAIQTRYIKQWTNIDSRSSLLQQPMLNSANFNEKSKASPQDRCDTRRMHRNKSTDWRRTWARLEWVNEWMNELLVLVSE